MSNLKFPHSAQSLQLLVLSLLTFGSLTGYSLAQVTGTGAVAEKPAPEEVTDEARLARQKRVDLLRQQILKAGKLETTFAKERSVYADTKAEHGTNCFMELRRANRDAKLPVAVRCYRGSLTANTEFLRALKTFVYGVPGVTEETKLGALQPLDALIDAIGVTVDAIDSDVFTSEEQLIETKKNLAAKYRVPLQSALDQLRIEKLAASIDPLILRIDEASDEEVLLGETNGWDTVASCLEDVQVALLFPEQEPLSLKEATKELDACFLALNAEEDAATVRAQVRTSAAAAAASSSSVRRR